jgi:NADH:ubiquinone oxidoreductase subunit C
MTWVERVSAAFPDAVDVRQGIPIRVRVVPEQWRAAMCTARDDLACTFFDFLTVAAEPRGGFRVVCHVARWGDGTVDRLLLEAVLPEEAPRIESVTDLFGGSAWHEREMHEMYGVEFAGGDSRPLLLAEGAPEFPLRKDFYLPARSDRPWPGAKEPGEGVDSADSVGGSSPSRRRLRPPGVPEEARRG